MILVDKLDMFVRLRTPENLVGII